MAVPVCLSEDHRHRGGLPAQHGGLHFAQFPKALSINVSQDEHHGGELAWGSQLQASITLQQEKVQPQRPADLLLPPPLPHAFSTKLAAGERHG